MIFALQLVLLLPSPAIVTVVVQLPQLEASSSGCYYCWSSLLVYEFVVGGGVGGVMMMMLRGVC